MISSKVKAIKKNGILISLVFKAFLFSHLQKLLTFETHYKMIPLRKQWEQSGVRIFLKIGLKGVISFPADKNIFWIKIMSDLAK